MEMTPTCHEGYKLLHDGVVALAQVEENGIKVNVDYLARAIIDTDKQIRMVKDEFMQTKLWSAWRRRFGTRAKPGSDDQLAELLYTDMGFEATKFTDTGKPSVDESALSMIDDPALPVYVRLSKLDKARNTYLNGIERETGADGFLHPIFSLNTARTFRSSSEQPNFQNQPIRDPVIGKLIRSNFESRFGDEGVLCENDYSGVEVKVAACYHKDPVMLSYIKDPTKDMHRDMSAQIFKLETSQVSKGIRNVTKNQFVFPQFYGDYYLNSAKSMWESITKHKLLGPDGKPLTHHLAAQGITRRGACSSQAKPVPGTFEHHMKEVENDFWNRRFMKYGQWKKRHWNQYVEEGGFDIYTGFRVNGVLFKNDVINYPVQGAAFHCLLWSLIRIQRELNRRGMVSVIVGQIHDSIVADVHVSELSDYLKIVQQVMTQDVMRAYPWLIVPLAIESDVTPPGASWHDKQPVHFDDTGYTFKNKKDEKVHFKTSKEFLRYLKHQHENPLAA